MKSLPLPNVDAAMKAHLRNRRRVLAAGGQVVDEDRAAILGVYLQAQRLTRETGIQHHVDHKRAISDGGAHSFDNLQVLTAEEHQLKTSVDRGTYYFAPIPERVSL